MVEETHEEEVSPEAPEEELEDVELDPAERNEKLAAEVEALRAKWMRAQADYQNLRRRSLSESESTLRRRLGPLLDELLLVLDFLDMALAAPVEGQEAKNLAMGVEMTRSKLVQALQGEEVREIPTDGPFDPALHEATETEADESAEPGSILRVVRKGYQWGETVLRHAHVVVAADPAGEAANGEAATEE